ncbi:hypothetical protein SAMN05444266_104240 [Chitinophaga jiangningensis]|uniref:DUF445 domain-containing protein n=1 Tax=Chitinophaga jiangningensis TaxID=1419482 RepID=A0A1M7C970_9BACT|nr:hypothetical protein [Chitinophaga jiangningensis]SHL63686.1 hypothetical protein SAMN05444266_104240 [Chitinophaga jiangningensis]
MLYTLPIIAALAGWLINSIAIRILLNQLPKRREKLAADLGALAGKQFSFAAVKQKLTDPEKVKSIIPVVETHLDGFLRDRLPKAMPVLSMFIGDSTINQIKSHLVAELDTLFPVMINQYLDNVEKDLNLEKIISDKISHTTDEQMQQAVKGFLGKELNTFKLLGAVSGLVIGLICLALLVLMP